MQFRESCFRARLFAPFRAVLTSCFSYLTGVFFLTQLRRDAKKGGVLSRAIRATLRGAISGKFVGKKLRYGIRAALAHVDHPSEREIVVN